MTTELHTVEDFIAEANTGCITGTAVFELTWENDFSRDVGGHDGWCVTNAEFLSLQIEGVVVADKNTLVAILGRHAVEEIERQAMEEAEIVGLDRAA